MKARLSFKRNKRVGFLQIYRTRGWIPQECPEAGIETVHCGEWCPRFAVIENQVHLRCGLGITYELSEAEDSLEGV